MLFKLYNIVTNKPVASRQREVYSMSGLSLKCILYEVDATY